MKSKLKIALTFVALLLFSGAVTWWRAFDPRLWKRDRDTLRIEVFDSIRLLRVVQLFAQKNNGFPQNEIEFKVDNAQEISQDTDWNYAYQTKTEAILWIRTSSGILHILMFTEKPPMVRYVSQNRNYVYYVPWHED